MSRYIRSFFGSLTIDNAKRAIKLTQDILGFARRADQIARDNNLDGVRRFTDKLVNNQAFNKLEKGVNISRSLVGAYEQQRQGGLFNRPIERSDLSRAQSIVNNMR